MARQTHLVAAFALAGACAMAAPLMASDADVAQVKQARATMNRLLGAHDMDGFRTWVAENTTEDVMISGPAWRNAGRDRVVDAYRERVVENRPLSKWDHDPDDIVVNEAQNFLTERGEYTQVWQGKGVTNQWKGSYFSLWKRASAGAPWKLDAEIFVPMKCTGDDECAPRFAGRSGAIQSTVPPRQQGAR